jgi:hypothetical protein
MQDMRALRYIAGKYESGRVLFSQLALMNAEDEEQFLSGAHAQWHLSETGAWQYLDALESEGGVVPPLAGGHLQQELLDLHNRIV